MSSAFYEGNDIKTIIRFFSADQIKHMLNVERLVDSMTKELLCNGIDTGLSEENSESYQYFGRAAFYHDIGKVYVPPEILCKPGKLTQEEVRMMHRHTVAAGDLFRRISDGEIRGMPGPLIPFARDCALYHHEWWNGEGYPFGISREHIPLVARITSICDAYDAIISDRVYRKANSHAFARREIEKNAGTQFDPMLTEIFLDHEAEIIGVLKKTAINGVPSH